MADRQILRILVLASQPLTPLDERATSGPICGSLQE
jgi:hypothetical protein